MFTALCNCHQVWDKGNTQKLLLVGNDKYMLSLLFIDSVFFFILFGVPVTGLPLLSHPS